MLGSMVRAGPVDHCVPSEAVEPCILHGLRWWRAAGFLHSKKIMAVFLKVGKSFLLASELTGRVPDLEQIIKSTWGKHRVAVEQSVSQRTVHAHPWVL